jgi:hypothetical protein
MILGVVFQIQGVHMHTLNHVWHRPWDQGDPSGSHPVQGHHDPLLKGLQKISKFKFCVCYIFLKYLLIRNIEVVHFHFLVFFFFI